MKVYVGKLHAVNVYAGKDPRTMTFSITTLVIMILCHYAECHCAECRDLFIVMLNVIMLSVAMMNVVMLSVVAPRTNVEVRVRRK